MSTTNTPGIIAQTGCTRPAGGWWMEDSCYATPPAKVKVKTVESIETARAIRRRALGIKDRK